VGLYLQERREKRAAADAAPAGPPSPAAPVITTGTVNWDVTTVGWADVDITYTFAYGTFPVANLEVWLAKASGGYVYSLLATIASSTGGDFVQTNASSATDTFRYKMRYKNGSVLGPFSNVYSVDIAPS
jgi:hypothetical protein